jgi:hypothetical protein
MAELRVKETGTIKLFESDNTSSVTIASPASLGADRTITLPDASVTLASGTMLATDGSGASLTALNASELGSGTVPTARLGSGTASSSTVLYGDQTYKAEPGGGLTNASMWYMAANKQGDTSPITDWTGLWGRGYLAMGALPTFSAGVFTFPSTGYWFINFTGVFGYDGDNRMVAVEMYTSTDATNYDLASRAYDGHADGGSGYTYDCPSTDYIYDVTDTANNTLKTAILFENQSAYCFGGYHPIATSLYFARLGDT